MDSIPEFILTALIMPFYGEYDGLYQRINQINNKSTRVII